jgi:chemotaxis protein MotB
MYGIRNTGGLEMADFNMDDDDAGGGEWLATYGDLVTLLLCFFILLFSMSTVDNKKIRQAISSLNSMGIMGQSGSVNENIGNTISNLDIYNAIDVQEEMDDIYTKVKEVVDSKGLANDVQIEKVGAGVLLRFKDEILFDVGQADLKINAKNTLQRLGEILKAHDKNIRVEGHTDNVPINTARFRSNWELSTSRAISVVKYFTEELTAEQRIDPKKFEVSGYGEYHPIATNDSEQNKQKNRRIEITILK